MFVEFECGCLGLRTEQGHWIVDDCCKDSRGLEDDYPCFQKRDLAAHPHLKSFAPASPIRVEEVIEKMNGLIAMGDKFRMVKALLR